MSKLKLEHFVVLSLSVVLIYTVAEFISGCCGYPHDGLTPYVYGFFAGEVVSTALIKIFKIRDNNANDNTADICNEGDL